MSSINLQHIQPVPSSSSCPVESYQAPESEPPITHSDDRLPPLGKEQHIKILSLLTNPYPVKSLDNTILFTMNVGKFLTKLITRYRQNIIGICKTGSATSYYSGKEYFERYHNAPLSSKLAAELETLPNDIDIRILFNKMDEGLIRIMKQEFLDYFCDELHAGRDIESKKPFSKLKYVEKSENGNHFSLIGLQGGEVKLEFIFTSGLQTDYLMQAYDLYIPLDSYLKTELMETPIAEMKEDKINQLIDTIPPIYPYGINRGGHQAIHDRLLKVLNVPMITNESGWGKILKYNMRGFQSDTSLIKKLIKEFKTYCNDSFSSATLYKLIKSCAIDQAPNDPALLFHLALTATFLFRNRLPNVEAMPNSEIVKLWGLVRDDPVMIIENLPAFLRNLLVLISDENGSGLQVACAALELASLFSDKLTKISLDDEALCENQWMLEFEYEKTSKYLQMQIIPELVWNQFCESIETNKHIKVLTQLFAHFFSHEGMHTVHQEQILELMLMSLKSDRQLIRMHALSFLAIVSKMRILTNRIVEDVIEILPDLYSNCPSTKAKSNVLRKASVILGKRFQSALKSLEAISGQKIPKKRVDFVWYSELSIIDSRYFFHYFDRISPHLRSDYACHFLKKGTFPTIELHLAALQRILSLDPSQLSNCLDHLDALTNGITKETLSNEYLIQIGHLILAITHSNGEAIFLLQKHQETVSSLLMILIKSGHIKTAEEILTATHRPNCIFLEKSNQMMLWNLLFESMEHHDIDKPHLAWKRAVERGIHSLEPTEEITPLFLLSLKIHECLERDLIHLAFSNFFRLLAQPIQKNQRPTLLHLFNAVWEKNIYHMSSDLETAFSNMFKIVEDQKLKEIFPRLLIKRCDEALQLASEHASTLKSPFIKRVLMTTLSTESLESDLQLSTEQVACKIKQIDLLLEYIWSPSDCQSPILDKTLLDRLLVFFSFNTIDPFLLISVLRKIQLNYQLPLDGKQTKICLTFLKQMVSDYNESAFASAEELFGKLLNQFEINGETFEILICILKRMISLDYAIDAYQRYLAYLTKHNEKADASQRSKNFLVLKDYLLLLEGKAHYPQIFSKISLWIHLPFIPAFLPTILTKALIEAVPEDCLNFLISIRHTKAIKKVLNHPSIIKTVTKNVLKSKPLNETQIEAILSFIPHQTNIDIKFLITLFLSTKKLSVAKHLHSFFKIFQKFDEKGLLKTVPNERFFLWNEIIALPGFLNSHICLYYLKNPSALTSIYSHLQDQESLVNFFKLAVESVFKALFPNKGDPTPFLQMIDKAHLAVFESLDKANWLGSMWSLSDKYLELLVPTQNETAYFHMIHVLITLVENSESEDIPKAMLLSTMLRVTKTFERLTQSKDLNNEPIRHLFDISAPLIAFWEITIGFLDNLMDSPLFFIRVLALNILKKAVWHPYTNANQEYSLTFVSCITKMIKVAKGIEISFLGGEINDTFTSSIIGDNHINRLFGMLVDKYLFLYDIEQSKCVQSALLNDCIALIENRFSISGFTSIAQCHFDRLNTQMATHFLSYGGIDQFITHVLKVAFMMPEAPYHFVQKALSKILIVQFDTPVLKDELALRGFTKDDSSVVNLIKSFLTANYILLDKMLVYTQSKLNENSQLPQSDLDVLYTILRTFIFNLELLPRVEYKYHQELINKLIIKIEDTFKYTPYYEFVSHFSHFQKWYPFFELIQSNPDTFNSTSDFDFTTLTQFPPKDLSRMLTALSTVSSFNNFCILLNILVVVDPKTFFSEAFCVGHIISNVLSFLRKNQNFDQNSLLSDLACSMCFKFSQFYHYKDHLRVESCLYIHKTLLEIHLNRLLITHPDNAKKIDHLDQTCGILFRAREQGLYEGYPMQYLIDVKEILRKSEINLHSHVLFAKHLQMGVKLTRIPGSLYASIPIDRRHHLADLLVSWILIGLIPKYGNKHAPYILQELNNASLIQIFCSNYALYSKLLEGIVMNDLSEVKAMVQQSTRQIKFKQIGEMIFYDHGSTQQSQITRILDP